MKKITLFLALAAITVAACQKSETAIPVSEQFTATVESFESQTKTSMTQEKYVVWSQNDRLAIFQGSTLADEFKVSDASAGKANGTFTKVTTAGDDFSAGTEIPCNVALYPYATGLTLTGATLEYEAPVYEVEGVVLPSEQTYVAGSFANGAFLMAAVTDDLSDHNLKFKNILGALKLQLKGTQTVKSITVKGRNNEKLSGAATVTAYASNLAPAITMTATDEASKSVTLDCGDGVQLSESTATDFIIALPPVLFSQGFTVTVTDSDEQTYEITAKVANTVLRSSVLTMPAIILGDEITEDEGDGDGSGINVMIITFDKTSLTLAPSTSYSIIPDVFPAIADDKTLTWSSSYPSIATVDQSGVVTAVSDGTATITAVAVGGASKSCTVKVVSLPNLATATADYVDEYGVNHGKGIAIGSTVWAPVNCGYKAATIDGAKPDKGFPYGKLYQWGRKYGQGYSADSDSEPKFYSGSVTYDIGQNKSMGDYFFKCESDWITQPDDSMWNSGTEDAPVKTANDPCPSGWRVPTYSELNVLITDHSDWTTNDGQIGYYYSGVLTTTVYDTHPLGEDKPQVFLPAAGYRDGRSGSATNRDSFAYYWSSRPSNDNTSHLLFFFQYSVEMRNYGRGAGYTVRCVQE
ncbi:MAG: Ig-like domain-containing protein [Bacteroidales bacterium]|nr:Ig-like domain-containing protein [Bacteroidales bacterium]